jgi:hypothetical protein
MWSNYRLAIDRKREKKKMGRKEERNEKGRKEMQRVELL